MAKTAKCAFCGTEVTTGLFTGNAEELQLTQTIVCCESCYEKFSAAIAGKEYRIKNKIENMKRSAKIKLSGEEIAKLVKLYLDEEQQQREKVGSQKADHFTAFFGHDEAGHFCVREFQMSGLLADDEGNSLEGKQFIDGVLFDKDDITRIEYRKATKVGHSTSLFSELHAFELRLNDEKVFTYKPCITKVVVGGKGLLPFLAAKNAEKRFVEQLQQFKQVIGTELPIVKVNKFK